MRWLWRKRGEREQELEREVLTHLETEAEEGKDAGLSAEEARYAAQRAFGNQSLTKESVRAAWGWTFVETMAQDLRYAFRSLRGSPVFASVAIASLGLGIGANTAIFSFVNALLLKQLPVTQPERLVTLAEYENGNLINSVFSLPMIAELDKRNQAFVGIFGRYPVRVSLLTERESELVRAEVVTGKYFATLQVKPLLGRVLHEDDMVTGNSVCVISYALWQGRFGADPNIVGRKVLLSSHPYTVVGVTEKGFFGPQLQSRIDMQLPVSMAGDFMNGPFVGVWNSAGFSWLEPLARLKAGVTAARAQAMIEPLARGLRMELGDQEERKTPAVGRRTYRLTDGRQGVNNDTTYFTPVTILMGVVGLVLLIACVNVANLLLARAGARAKELAVRLSLGASQLRLVRQLMVESGVLALGGGLLGLALAFWISHTLLHFLNSGESEADALRVPIDPQVIGFSVLLSVLTAVVFGLVPAWQSAKPDVIPELKNVQGQFNAVKTRRFLIVLQIGLSMMILFAAGLMTRTLSGLRTIDLGFDPTHVIMLRIDPAMNGYSGEQGEHVFDELLARLRAQPGVTAASLGVVTPLEGAMISLGFEVPGRAAENPNLQTNFNMISPDYFRTVNQPLLAGRDFTERDVKRAPLVAIVNQLFVNQYMPHENPLGRHLKMGNDEVTIVGLVKDSRYQELKEKFSPLIYLPVKQTESSGYTVFVRTLIAPKQAIVDIEHTVRAVDSKLPIYSVQEFQDVIDHGIRSERVLTFLSALFGGLATLLCCMGIYGLIAYAVSRRTREIGVRFAVGAQKSDVARLFFGESVRLILTGAAVGVPLALASARVLKSLLYGVEPTDSFTLLLSVGIFLAAGILASVLLVRRATRIEPMQALRYE